MIKIVGLWLVSVGLASIGCSLLNLNIVDIGVVRWIGGWIAVISAIDLISYLIGKR